MFSRFYARSTVLPELSQPEIEEDWIAKRNDADWYLTGFRKLLSESNYVVFCDQD